MATVTHERQQVRATGRPMKYLSIAEEYTRECVALEIDRSITAEQATDMPVDLFRIRAGLAVGKQLRRFVPPAACEMS
jgi:hypothetical protein